jgi:hypothetical protein
MLFEKHFKKVPVLPTFGNNDDKYHYQPATDKNEISFYEFIYTRWFEAHTANNKLDNLDEIRSTLSNGGWYRVNLIPDELTLLSFDSL